MTDITRHNQDAWDRKVERGGNYTIPVGAEAIAAARVGEPRLFLTPTKPIPKEWLAPVRGLSVLCLASGGGQQGPLLAAAGAYVTVFDISSMQLAQDRRVAEREGLDIRTVQGDMRDLSAFGDGLFDLIVHPVSNVFVPDILPVWREAYRVLRHGGRLLSGFDNPAKHIFADPDCEDLRVANRLPYSDVESLSREAIAARAENGIPLEFSHNLEDQIGGQISAGFAIIGFYEDRDPSEHDCAVGRYMPTYIATRALKG